MLARVQQKLKSSIFRDHMSSGIYDSKVHTRWLVEGKKCHNCYKLDRYLMCMWIKPDFNFFFVAKKLIDTFKLTTETLYSKVRLTLELQIIQF